MAKIVQDGECLPPASAAEDAEAEAEAEAAWQ